MHVLQCVATPGPDQQQMLLLQRQQHRTGWHGAAYLADHHGSTGLLLLSRQTGVHTLVHLPAMSSASCFYQHLVLPAAPGCDAQLFWRRLACWELHNRAALHHWRLKGINPPLVYWDLLAQLLLVVVLVAGHCQRLQQ